MSKAKLIGYNKPYIPNSLSDMRKRKLYQRNREYTDKHDTMMEEKREKRIMAEIIAAKED